MLQLGRFPRVRPAHSPTPLDPETRVHCIGSASGGNNTGKLEHRMADAVQQDGGQAGLLACAPASAA